MSYKCFEGYGNLGEQKGFDIIHTIINCIDIKKMHRSIEPIDENASIGEFNVDTVKG